VKEGGGEEGERERESALCVHWGYYCVPQCTHSSLELLFITTVPNTNLCASGEEDSGGHVL
jgi:hypothetical protein